MASSYAMSSQYGSIKESTEPDDFENGLLPASNNLLADEKKSNGFYMKLSFSVAFALLICIAVTVTPQSYVNEISNTLLREGPTSMNSGSDLPPVMVSSAPTRTGPASRTPAVVMKVPMKSSKPFGLVRDGYSYILPDNEPLAYTIVKSHNTVLEPYVPMNLYLPSASVDQYYKFSVCSDTTCYDGVYSLSSSVSNVTVSVPCTPQTTYKLIYTSYDISTNEVSGSDKGTALCMYVRREIRMLNDDDLAKTLDAMYQLWVVNDSDGKEKYGQNYISASSMTKFHHFNAAWQDADHIHEGNGFLLQHLKMTNMFEQSMQSVDPSVSLPYWDYTIDSSEGRSAINSYVMTPKVFGGMTVPADIEYGFGPSKDKIINAAIPNGRWAYIKAESSDEYPDLKHAFGYIRAPWNMNPSPYVSRYTYDYRIGVNIPSCTSHYKLLEESTMMKFFYESAYDAHATVHSLIGGIYGCEVMKPLLDQGYITSTDDLKQICSKWVFNLKEFYRSDFIQPKSNCSLNADDIDATTCGFECQDKSEEGIGLFKKNIKARLGSHIPSDIDDDGMNAWFNFVCDGDAYRIFAGDHLESASPADPSFWVMHPTLDRLYQAKIMSGGFSDSHWNSDIMQEFVCEKSRCYEPNQGLKDKKTAMYSECCYGHYENDQLYDAFSKTRDAKVGPTNGDMVKMNNPSSSSYGLTYIYDSFAWSHCSNDFNGLLTGVVSVPANEVILESKHDMFKISTGIGADSR